MRKLNEKDVDNLAESGREVTLTLPVKFAIALYQAAHSQHLGCHVPANAAGTFKPDDPEYRAGHEIVDGAEGAVSRALHVALHEFVGTPCEHPTDPNRCYAPAPFERASGWATLPVGDHLGPS